MSWNFQVTTKTMDVADGAPVQEQMVLPTKQQKQVEYQRQDSDEIDITES